VTFRFPDVEGREVSLDDPRFAGKVVLVTTSGSWCPTCHDEAAFLAPWFREHSARGVEIVSLMYEHSADRAEAVQAVRNFQRRYDIGYDLLIAGTSDKDSASASLPMLNAMLVYPTLIAIDRRGQVRRIHTGFPGPATGEHHARFRRDFEALMNELISEST
jgi:peroxiredoxin